MGILCFHDIRHVQLFSYDLHSAGDRYSQVHYGLLIRNITEADNGIYTCCAEVQTTGALAQRDIEVIVYCKFVTGVWPPLEDLRDFRY